MSPLDRPRISPQFLARHKRVRTLAAITELSAEKGYEATTITDIAHSARLGRKTLYELFGGKEAIFLAAVEATVDELREQLDAACEAAGPDPNERLGAALEALLSFLAADPGRADLLLVEAPSALPASAAIYDREFSRLTDRLRSAAPASGSAPEAIEEALVGGIASILSQRVRRGEAARLSELLPELEELLLAPWGDAVKHKGKKH